jgi:hypothetical protein
MRESVAGVILIKYIISTCVNVTMKPPVQLIAVNKNKNKF